MKSIFSTRILRGARRPGVFRFHDLQSRLAPPVPVAWDRSAGALTNRAVGGSRRAAFQPPSTPTLKAFLRVEI